MRIIGLYGRSNCGKTQTLNYLKDILRIKGKSISLHGPHGGDEPETFEVDGKIICVAPGGDTEKIVKNNIAYFQSKHCDIAISASRCRGGSPKVLNDFAATLSTTIEWYHKSNEENLSAATKDAANKETAKFLYSRL